MLNPIVMSLVALTFVTSCAHGTSTTPDDRAAQHATFQPRAAGAYLEIMLMIDPANRAAAAGVYTKYKQPFLDTVPGAISKQLLVRGEDVVVLHGFDTPEHAADYLKSSLFNSDVVTALKPLLAASPDVRIYSTP